MAHTDTNPRRPGGLLAASSERAAYLMLTATVLFWAGNAVIARGVHGDIHPVVLATWRWVLATVILLPFAWRHLRADLPALRARWPLLVGLAALGISLFNTLLYHAAQTTTATNIALVQSTMPAVIVLFAWLLFAERVSLRGALGVAVSVSGAVLVVARGDWTRVVGLDLVAGDLWMLLAVVDYALYSVLLRRRPDVHPLSFAAFSFAAGSLLLAPFYVIVVAAEGLPAPSPALGAAVIYVATLPSIAAYLFWNRGVDLVGASRAGFFICLIPVFTALLAAVFLGEALAWYHGAGLALIVAGFLLFRHPVPPPAQSRP